MDFVAQKVNGAKKIKLEADHKLANLERLESRMKQCSSDVERAICLLEFGQVDNMKHLLNTLFPDLKTSRDFWLAFLRSTDRIPRLYTRYSTFDEDIIHLKVVEHQDRDVVIGLCSYDPLIWSNWLITGDYGNNWAEDEEVIKAVLESNPTLFKSTKHSFQEKYPNLIAAAVGRLPKAEDKSSLNSYERSISKSLWSRKDMALAWASIGGSYRSGFPEDFQDDQDIILAFLKNGSKTLNFSSRLSASKDFMLEVLKINPCYLKKASSNLIGDWDLLLTAMADSRFIQLRDFGRWVGSHGYYFGFLVDTSNSVRQKLMLHADFVKTVLCGVKLANKSAPITLLNQDSDTLEAYLKPIAEYLGAPIGNEYRMLREAQKNLALMGLK